MQISATPQHQLYSSDQCQIADKYAIETLGILGLHLMQAAGYASWDQASQLFSSITHVIVLCGPGNNGGDGWVFAQAAVAAQLQVTVFATDSHTQDALAARAEATLALQAQGAEIAVLSLDNLTSQCAKLKLESLQPEHLLIVDALFGIGLHSALKPEYEAIIEFVNNLECKRLALDVPTGINATTGNALGHYFKAHTTITFILAKQGLYRGAGRAASGLVQLADLGLPVDLGDKLNQRAFKVFRDHVDTLPFIERAADSHKGDFGTLLCVGGDEGMGGAIIIAAESAVRFGAGKVVVASSTAHNSIAITRCPSIMSKSLDNFEHIISTIQTALITTSTLVLGPGLGQSAWSLECFNACFTSNFAGACVLDADALNLIAEHQSAYDLIMQQQPITGQMIMTPHPKEAHRLLCQIDKQLNRKSAQSTSTTSSLVDPFEIALTLSLHFNCICLLKGHGTIIANGTSAFVCETGNESLAKAGQGDCLSGMLGALLAQGLSPLNAARQGAWAHGMAGEHWSTTQSNLSLLPHETASIAAKAIQQQRNRKNYETA